MNFYIGQIFEDIYPQEASDWCNEKGTCHIEEIEPYGDIRRFQIIVTPKEEDNKEERLARTYMTKWDFVKYVLNPHKFTYAMLKEVLAKDIALEEAWACCSAIYRGDDTLCTNLPKLLPTVTTAFLDEAFETYGTYGGQ